MDCDYIHLRDETGQLMATIAYLRTTSNAVYYGATVVSPSEPRNTVSLKEGRRRAKARCCGAIGNFDLNEGSDWRPRHSRRNKIINVLERYGIRVCGIMNKKTFFKVVAEARNYFMRYGKGVTMVTYVKCER